MTSTGPDSGRSARAPSASASTATTRSGAGSVEAAEARPLDVNVTGIGGMARSPSSHATISSCHSRTRRPSVRRRSSVDERRTSNAGPSTSGSGRLTRTSPP
jgi:hypothetical protein